MGFGLRYKWSRFKRYSYLRRAEDYRDALRRSRPVISYIGFLGHRNVGDEALYNAYRDYLFRDALLVAHDDFSPLAALSSLNPNRIVMLGGGTLINVTPYLLELEKLVARNENFVVWGSGVADLSYWSQHAQHKDRGNADRWLEVLRRAGYVGVRGPRSVRTLTESGIKGVEMLGDPALSIPAAKRTRRSSTQVVGINLGSHDPVSGGDQRVFDSVLALIPKLFAQGYEVEYFSLHRIDLEIGHSLKAKLGDARLRILPFDSDVDQTMSQLADMDYAIGQRLHATILACAQGTPNLSLSYQPKCLDFLESIDQAKLALPTDSISPEALVERFEWLVANAATVAKDVRHACDHFRALQSSRASNLLAELGAGRLQSALG